MTILRMLKIFLKYGGALLATYFVAWTGAYVFVMGMNFDFYVKYFKLAWGSGGLEIVSAIYCLSLLAFIPMFVVVVIQLRKVSRKNSAKK